MIPMRPIEIIGGGLAGLSLGLALRRAGAPVSVFEAGAYPRHRVCGEFITGLAASTIARLGLEPPLRDALLHHDVAWFIDGQPVRRQRLPAPARAISRHRLDARLAGALVESGGQLQANTRVANLVPAPGRVFTTGRRRAPSPWLGLKIHARNLPLHCDLELHLGDEAYLGLTRVEDGRVNVCGLFRRRDLSAPGAALLLAYLRAARLPALAGRLAGADFDPESFAAVAGVAFDPHVPAAGRLALGDACAMVPPFTGNGMAMAFQSAEIALDPLLAYAAGSAAWPATTRAIQRALARRFRLRLAAADLLHPFLLQPPRQRWLTRLGRVHLLPLRPLYSVLH
jgi:flavin-dependent dehydrogenase